MRNLIKIYGKIVLVVLVSAVASVLLNVIFSGMLSIIFLSPFKGIFSSNPMGIITIIAFLLGSIMGFSVLEDTKK